MENYERSEQEISLMILLDQLLSYMDVHDAITVIRRVYCGFQRGIIASALAVPNPDYECEEHSHACMEEELYRRPTRGSISELSDTDIKIMKDTLQ